MELQEQPLCLSQGCMSSLKSSGTTPDQPVVLKVKTLTVTDKGKYMAILSDGIQEIQAALASQLNVHAQSGKLRASSIIKVLSCTANKVADRHILVVTDMEVLSTGSDASGDAVVAVNLGTPAPKTLATTATVKMESPLHTPSIFKQERDSGPTPPSAAPLSVSQRTSGFALIGALHPYDEQWRIKAKLARKLPMRSIKLKGVDTSVFSVELIDEEGGQIQGTFWRGQADRWYGSLEEGKVYVFERFSVKPANKQYSSVRHDYEIAFTDKTDVSEAADQTVSKDMNAAVQLVAIDNLQRYVARKATVDVMGVLVAVGGSGTVKRKTDNSELSRRDITIADKSGKTVVLTLWGENVMVSGSLEGQENQVVVQCTGCRVTDYNGCSLSTLTRSVLTMSPDTPEARELMTWWQDQGHTLTLQPVGGENTRTSGGGPGGVKVIHMVKEVTGQPVPALDAKPAYHNIIATVAYVNPEQTMFYLANPETGKKVVPQDGRFYSEADGKICDHASYRYVMSLKALDATGDVYLNLFNEQAVTVMSATADELAHLKSNSEQEYISRCKNAQWSEWSVTVATKSREYQGERRMRHTVLDLKPISFQQESQKLLAMIESYA